MGSHTKYGGFIVEWDKVRTYVVPPNLKDFKAGLIFVPLRIPRLLLTAHTFRNKANKVDKGSV